jgi:hypothetical protein
LRKLSQVEFSIHLRDKVIIAESHRGLAIQRPEVWNRRGGTSGGRSLEKLNNKTRPKIRLENLTA